MLHRFEPFIKEGDISNLPAYNFYIRIQAQESLEPMSGQTVVLPPEEASEDMATTVMESSQEKYATTYVKPAEPKNLKKPNQNNKNGAGKGKKSNKREDSGDALDANDDT